MVKIHCDKCGAEIKNKYYTVNIYGYDTNPQPSITTAYAAAACASSSTRDDILRILNAQKIYCKDCREKIEKFINGD
jgi:hypothetical protein